MSEAEWTKIENGGSLALIGFGAGSHPSIYRKDLTMANIKLSKKYGLNAAIPVCYFCNEPKNELIIPGLLKGDVEAPKNAVWNMEPCDKCKEYMNMGVILISVKNGESGKNPYRTGGWAVVKDEAVAGIFGENTPALKYRVAFIEDEAWDKIGLPRG